MRRFESLPRQARILGKAAFCLSIALLAASILLDHFGVGMPDSAWRVLFLSGVLLFHVSASFVAADGSRNPHLASMWLKLAVIGGFVALILALWMQLREWSRPRWVSYICYAWGALSMLWVITNVHESDLGWTRKATEDEDDDSPGNEFRRLRRKKRR
ncbi:MAG: hypothetical protein ACYTDX_02315 [Planctomycetota bacterium]|jgi:phosphatidylglycerophosphate synthase